MKAIDFFFERSRRESAKGLRPEQHPPSSILHGPRPAGDARILDSAGVEVESRAAAEHRSRQFPLLWSETRAGVPW
jgi:hypothetical protein